MNAILRSSRRRHRFLHPWPARFWWIASCCLLLASCGDSGKKTPAATAIPSNTAAANEAIPSATPAPAKIGDIVWASKIDPATHAPVTKAAGFRPSSAEILAAVPVQNVTPGVAISASWTYNDAALKGMESTIVATQPMTNGWIEFHLTLAAGQSWPKGTYQVSITEPNVAPVTSTIDVTKAGT